MNKKIKTLIVDDEPVALDILTNYMKKVSFLVLKGAYRNPLKAQEYLKGEPVDLLFLDINMPVLSGIQFLNSLDRHPMVIFTTAYSEYAVQSYEFEAVDYLLKPIEFDRFLKAANRALTRFQSIQKSILSGTETAGSRKPQYTDSIAIKSGTEFFRINIKDISFIKAMGNYVIFIVGKKEIISLMTMKEALARLPRDSFFRIHKSYIVNFHHIEVLDYDEVRIQNSKIPIGSSYKEAFFKLIN